MFRGKGIAGVIFRTSFTNVVVLVLTTLTSILTARMLGVVGKGELAAITFWPILFAGLMSFGLPTSLIYNLKKDPEHASDYIKICTSIIVPLGAIVGVILWFFLPIMLQQYSQSAIHIAQLFTLVMVPLQIIINILLSLSKAIDQFHIYNGMKLNSSLITLIGLVLLWLLGGLSLFSSTLVYLCTSIIVLIICIRHLMTHMTIDFKKFSKTRVRPLLSYGIIIYGQEILGTVYNQADKIIIISLLSPREFGLYTVVFS
ncbi:lipopolysaccharide biosynthesis protein [Paenibacillus ihuae]|uniref:lipopolysaccharide biosynthesis protein n=1 Tax=Paenibacillus ihuae TaxID=1232431 RepID=UPI001FD72CE9|nr:oligosaccharide flippase family protein [Paenibacillus ihuae]